MAVTKSQAKVHSVPTSKLSKFPAYTKPENREIGTKISSPEKANAALRKVHF